MRTAALQLSRRVSRVKRLLFVAQLRSLPRSICTFRQVANYSSVSRNLSSNSHLATVPQDTISFPGSGKNGEVYQFKINERTGQASFETQASPDDDFHIPMNKAEHPGAWAELFDRYLPQPLRISHVSNSYEEINSRKQLLEIATILNHSRDANHGILAWMIIHGREKAAVYLIESILKYAAKRTNFAEQKMPSNLAWPSTSLESMCDGPINVQSFSYLALSGIQASDISDGGTYKQHSVGLDGKVLGQIWSTLGNLVIRSADLDEEASKEILRTVMLLLGKIHNLGLMPEDMYSYTSSSQSSVLQRPPIMHLLYSRILTSLSDAVWRDQQDTIIDEAASLGMDYKEIGRNAPGGRFRLKVRPLEPEVWLEMILWCCVEGGYSSAAMKIIKTLKREKDRPWFAIRWNSTDLKHQRAPHIDWKRVKTRHGGPVGLMEGYSREKPFVEIPTRTISLEVVTALIDLLLNTVDPGISEGQLFNSMKLSQSNIATVIEFLEPHDLPPEYTDYITVRLVQSEAFDMDRTPNPLRRWCDKVSKLKKLATLRETSAPPPSLALDSIFAYSEFSAGIRHQVLDGMIHTGDFHQALHTFNQIQENVDASKLNSIQAFLHAPRNPSEGFFSSRSFASRLEYVGSHGQIPYYKLGGLLNLISDTNMPGLGRWLLYAEDVDGTLIPRSAYGVPSLFVPLIRFAAISEDDELLGQVLQARMQSPMKLTVRMLRALVNSHIDYLDFAGARLRLNQLVEAQAGGYNFDNVAHLGAVILRLEGQLYQVERSVSTHFINTAKKLLTEILQGNFNSSRGDFTRTQRILFGQQMGHILRLFKSCKESELANVSLAWSQKFPIGNAIDLPTSSFNTFLSAVVDIRGAHAGMELWKQFCKLSKFVQESDFSNEDGRIMTIRERDDQSYDAEFVSWLEGTKKRSDTSSSPFIPFQAEDIEAQHDQSLEQGNHDLETATAALPLKLSDNEDIKLQDSTLQPDSRFQVILEPTNAFSNKGFKLESQNSSQENANFDSDPITVPDLRTIRLIARSAVDAKERLRSQGFEADEQNQVLKWCVKTFHKFFDAPKALIEQEIQEPLTDDDLKDLYREDWHSIDTKVFYRRQQMRVPRQGNLRLRSAFEGRLITQHPNEFKVRAVTANE